MDNGRQAKVKMSGYLHKKCKKRMISSWKMYWFVLEDRLLLYYRSKDEYQAISPCKGSINLGPPCTVKSFPSVANAFQIVTRNNTVTLRAESTEDQMKWMQTIMSALNQNQNFTTETPKKLNHFRYSLDDIVPEREPNDDQIVKKTPLGRQNTMPDRLKTESENKEIIQRLQKIGAQSYGGSLGTISKIATKKTKSPNLSINRGSQSSLRETSANDKNEVNDGEKIVPVLRPLRSLHESLYERISGDSSASQSSNRTSFVVDNDNYSVPLRRGLQRAASEGASGTNSILVENDQYCRIQRSLKESIVVENDHYCRLSKDSAKDSVLVENDHYSTVDRVSNDERIYAEPKTDHNKNSVLVENTFYVATSSRNVENVYEDLDKNIYSEPILKSEDTSSQSSQETRLKGKLKSKDEGKNKSVKKSRSFIKRVWKKRSKKLERQQPQEEEEEEKIYEEVDPKTVEKLDYNNDNAVQMLSELQNILEHKKSMLKAAVSNNSSKSEDKPDDDKTNKASTSESDLCPTLPPKTHKNLPKPTRPIDHESVRSLDEILEDLNKEKLESKSKVKQLIEKFSEPESDDVILRKHERVDFKISRHSDDLNKLLDELAKVTSAPIMTPGVTSSLVNPSLPDEEWLKLLPRRQRRLSEPDYDVPRPHKSIQLPAKSENSDAIPATRFFGPVLPPTIADNSPTKEDSFCASMAPDSLEVEEQKSPNHHNSYTSHNYYQCKNDEESADSKCFSRNFTNQDDEKIIYAMPKSYLSVATHIVNTCQNICSAQLAEECTIIYKNVKNVDLPEEIFKDSLELCNESATEF